MNIMLFLRPDRYLFISCYFFYRAEILDGDKSLVIKNVVPSDEGIYVCEAQNSVGQITSKAQLVVNCEYCLRFLLFRLLLRLFWLFIAGVSSLNFRSSEYRSGRCRINNKSQFKVRWYYNFSSTLSSQLPLLLAAINGHKQHKHFQ